MSQASWKRKPRRSRYEQTRQRRSVSTSSVSAALSPGLRQRHMSSVSASAERSSSSASIPSNPDTYALSGRISTSSRSSPGRDQLADASGGLSPETNAEAHDHELDDFIQEVVMAIDMRSRDTIGCCYYVAAEEKLYIFNDILHDGVEIFATLRDTIEPTSIVVSARIDGLVDNILDREESQTVPSISHERSRLPYHIQVFKTSQFDFENGKRRLAQLDTFSALQCAMTFAVPGDDATFETYNAELDVGLTAQHGKLLRLSTTIDLSSRLSIGCASAILDWIQTRRLQTYTPGDERANLMLRIVSVEMVNLENVVYVNSDTLAALQIMESESHPHAQNQGPNDIGSKESLSVYGLFQHCAKSPQGKQRLRSMFIRPTMDLDLIAERHESIATFILPDNSDHVDEMVSALKSIKNIRAVLIHLRKGTSGGADRSRAFKCNVWTTIKAFAFHTLGVLGAARKLQCRNRLKIITRILENFEAQKIALVGRDIEHVVDFRQSTEEGRTVVNVGVDESLDATRRTYAGIEHLLSRVNEDVVRDYNGHSEAAVVNVVTYPQIGFLISVHIDEGSQRFPATPPPQSNRSVWERIFTSGQSAYYKDDRMRALDQRFGDILGNIHDREIELTFELAQRILDDEDLFCRVSDICGELDALLALAQGASAYNLCRPTVVTDNVIDIVGGRHLLQENLTSRFIANDTFLTGGNSYSPSSNNPMSASRANIFMLTGPNYSGKSVYLKQVALIVYLAHIGSFVPALTATIGVTDKILTRISTRETVSRQHSAFMIDLQQISTAMCLCSARSLLVIDEFGKGTEAADGAGLAAAVFEHLVNLGDMTPKVIAATHYHDILENGLLRDSRKIAFHHMEVSIDKTASLEEQVTYLYALRPGRSVASFGTVCAAMNGIDPRIIARSHDIIGLQARGDLLAAHGKLTEGEKVDLALAERLGRQFLLQDFSTPPGASSSNPREFLAGFDFEDSS